MDDYYELDDLETRLYNQVYHSPQIEDNLAKNINDGAAVKDSCESGYFGNNPKQSGKVNVEFASNFNKQNVNSKFPDQQQVEDATVSRIVYVNSLKNYYCLGNDDALSSESNRQKKNRQRAELKKLKKKKRRVKQKMATNNRLKINPINKAIKDSNEIILLSDSDNDDCVEIPTKWPMLCIEDSDDDQTGPNPDGDIDMEDLDQLTVETIVKNADNPEIINENVKSESNVAIIEHTIIKNFEILKTVDSTASYQLLERKQLLHTPESNSNDFLENTATAETNENFNFSLHGSDFNTSDLPKTANPTETYETESSTASTTDQVNPLKSVVFNEVEFPKTDLFGESNLESFSQFITPKRKEINKKSNNEQSSLKKSIAVVNSSQSNVIEADNSSSESDFDDCEVISTRVQKLQKINNLPKLSPVQFENEKQNASPKLVLSTENVKSQSISLTSSVNLHSQSKKNNYENSEVSMDIVEAVMVVNNDEYIDTESHKDNEAADNSVINEPVVILSDSESNLSHLESEVQDLNINYKRIKEKHITKSSSFERVTFKDHWMENKDLYYTSPINVDGFNVGNILNSMRDDPSLWQILEVDRFSIRNKRKRSSYYCKICYEYGHTVGKCPTKTGGPKCNLCGVQGHEVRRCPNKVCFQCGTLGDFSTTYCKRCHKWKYYTCDICYSNGHSQDICPDLWRRYHSTTEEGPLINPGIFTLKSKESLWCSGCAQNGHLEHDCRFYCPAYLLSNPSVIRYDDIYKENEQNTETTDDNSNRREKQIQNTSLSTTQNREQNRLWQKQNFRNDDSDDQNRDAIVETSSLFHKNRTDCNESSPVHFPSVSTIPSLMDLDLSEVESRLHRLETTLSNAINEIQSDEIVKKNDFNSFDKDNMNFLNNVPQNNNINTNNQNYNKNTLINTNRNMNSFQEPFKKPFNHDNVNLKQINTNQITNKKSQEQQQNKKIKLGRYNLRPRENLRPTDINPVNIVQLFSNQKQQNNQMSFSNYNKSNNTKGQFNDEMIFSVNNYPLPFSNQTPSSFINNPPMRFLINNTNNLRQLTSNQTFNNINNAGHNNMTNSERFLQTNGLFQRNQAMQTRYFSASNMQFDNENEIPKAPPPPLISGLQRNQAYRPLMINNTNNEQMLLNNVGRNQFYQFEDNLPNFISFDDDNPNQNQQKPNTVVDNLSSLQKKNIKLYDMSQKGFRTFSNEQVSSIKQLLSQEFGKLGKMRNNIKHILQLLKKQSYWIDSSPNTEDYYRKLNMVLFGLYQLKGGRRHMNKLKRLNGAHPKMKLSKSKRLELYDSYTYIFGDVKHSHVNYLELLSKVGNMRIYF